MGAALRRIIAIVATLAVASCTGQPVFAHSWYDKDCCDIRDCEPMTEDYLPVEGGMYVLPNGERVSVDKTRPSLDGKFHWCRSIAWAEGQKRTLIRPADKPNCLYVPNNGV